MKNITIKFDLPGDVTSAGPSRFLRFTVSVLIMHNLGNHQNPLNEETVMSAHNIFLNSGITLNEHLPQA